MIKFKTGIVKLLKTGYINKTSFGYNIICIMEKIHKNNNAKDISGDKLK